MSKDILKVILLIDTSRGSGRKLLHGINKYSRMHGPWTFNRKSIYFAEYQTEYKKFGQWEEEIFLRLEKWNAQGVIASNVNNERQFNRILAMDLPTIVLGGYKPEKPVPKYHRVRSDSLAIGKMAAEHLLDCRLCNFAYCGFYNIFWSQERAAGFAQRIADAGFDTHLYKPPESRIKRLWENEQVDMINWLNSLPKPLGLMACNDDRGQQILEACKIAGLNVPDEVAIIGVDDDTLVCELSDPPMSSISLNNERGGYEAAELLAKLMVGKKIRHQEIIVQPTKISTRESTNNLMINDSNVANAVRFIRQNATSIIHVEDVVEASMMSRRSLERKFRQTLGRSLLVEINRVHVEQFAKMLTETNLTISQIAQALGHPSSENICRYFRKEKGMPPTTYRKKYGAK